MAGGELYDVVEKRGSLPEDEARTMAKQLFVSQQITFRTELLLNLPERSVLGGHRLFTFRRHPAGAPRFKARKHPLRFNTQTR